ERPKFPPRPSVRKTTAPIAAWVGLVSPRNLTPLVALRQIGIISDTYEHSPTSRLLARSSTMFSTTRLLRPATCLTTLVSSGLAFGCAGHDSAADERATFAQRATLEVMSETGDLAVELRSFPEALPVRGRNRVQLT